MTKFRTAAAIDIGSNGVRMQISQSDGTSIQSLTRLEKPTRMGQEVFTTGRISFETARGLSSILSGFQTAAKEYDVKRVEVVATTSLRDAVNRGYVLDYISIRNKLNVRVLEDNESNALQIYAMKSECNPDDERVLMAYVGTGTVNFQLLEQNRIMLTQTMHTGLLPIADMLRETSEYTRRVDLVAEEYVETLLARHFSMRELSDVDSLVFGSGDMRPLFEFLGVDTSGNVSVIESDRIMEAFRRFRRLSIGQISTKLQLSSQQGDQLLAALALLSVLITRTGVKKAYCVHTGLADAVARLNLLPGAKRAYNEGERNGAVSSARNLAERYGCNVRHSEKVAEIATLLYGKLYKIHGLPRKHVFKLQVACILHEAGYFVHSYSADEAAFNLIRYAQIYGLSSYDTLLIASIVAPLGITEGNQTAAIKDEDVLFVAKMHAILQLADALDYSGREKIDTITVEQEENELTVRIRSAEDYTQEAWLFRQRVPFFRETFGLTVQLDIDNKFETAT